MLKNIIHIGTNGLDEHTSRQVQVTNRVILITLLFMIAITLITLGENFKNGVSNGMGLKGFAILCILLIGKLLLHHHRLFLPSKILLSLELPFFILVFPAFDGIIHAHYYFWMPYMLITMLVIVHLIFDHKKEIHLVILISSVYFLLLLVLENLIRSISGQDLPIHETFIENKFHLKLAQISVFLFFNITLYILFLQLHKFHEKLFIANLELKEHHEELQTQNEELQTNQEELFNKNEELNSILSKLKETQARLVQSEKMAAVGTLVSGFAHELNNPLNYIYGGVQTLEPLIAEFIENREHYSKEELDKLASEIYQLTQNTTIGVERMNTIMEGLMKFTQRGNSVLISCEIHHIIDNILLILKPKFPSHLIVQRQFGFNGSFVCYSDKMHQLIFSIVDNALFALNNNSMANSPNLNFKTESVYKQNKPYLKITIGNNGPKIPENIMGKIFEPFFTTKDPDKGTGLGLAISYGIVEELGGTIHCSNSDMVEFTIEIPIK